MAFPNLTTAGGPERLLRNYWRRKLLGVLENNLLAGDLMDRQVIPANAGRVIEFHRINNFSKQMTKSNEIIGASTAAGMKGRVFTVDSIVYAIEMITNDLSMSEESIMTAEPNPIPTLTDRFLYNAADSLDQRYINIMVSNTGNTQSATAPSVDFAGSSVSTGTVWGDGSQTLTEATLDADNPSHRIAAETFNTVYTKLRSQSAKPRAGQRMFDALIAPEVAGDLRTDATFQDIALKATETGTDKFERASIGSVFGCRVIESENVGVPVAGTIDATNDEIFRCVACGDGYAARISHAKGIGVPSVNFIPPAKVDKADPYGLLGILTWKIYTAVGGVLNPLAGQLIKVATTRTKNTDSTDDSTWNT
jgi:N4-gp56 family major capsid protein